MKRRQFLQSLAALGAVPLVPSMGTGALAFNTGSAATPAVSAHTYKWAEVIVRAHKTSSLAMLQRHLRLDVAAAKALQNQLISNGVIGAHANVYGLHQATNPLFDGLFPQPSKIAQTGKNLNEKMSSSIRNDVENLDFETDAGEDRDANLEIPITSLYNESDWSSHLAA